MKYDEKLSNTLVINYDFVYIMNIIYMSLWEVTTTL